MTLQGSYMGGSGAPRLVVQLATAFFSSASTTFSATGVTLGGSPDLSNLSVYMRARSTTSGGEDTWGKITNVDDGGDVLTVDSWNNGTPANGQTVYVDGWVLDLPRPMRLTERMEPDYLTHELYGGDKGTRLSTRFRGWKYGCTIDYGTYMDGADFANLWPALNLALGDLLVLMPHKDAPSFQYPVIFAAPIEFSRYGVTPGHSGIKLQFVGKENVHEWPILGGYGYGYGRSYGNQL